MKDKYLLFTIYRSKETNTNEISNYHKLDSKEEVVKKLLKVDPPSFQVLRYEDVSFYFLKELESIKNHEEQQAKRDLFEKLKSELNEV